MTRLVIDRKFRKAGWRIIHGKSHDQAVSPTGQKVSLPRHRGDLAMGTVLNILKMSICCN